MPSDIEIAQAATMQRINKVALEKLGIAEEHLEPYGHYKAKVSFEYLDSLKDRKNGKLILVTAISPTPAGEGKTTTTVGLGDALNHIGKKAVICLREPSLGPVFGVKGGAAGGGYAQVVPMEDINLHFTGDFGAIQLANNLLAALIDNHINHGNELGIDVRRIQWKRVLDMNDRALRDITIALGGTANGYPREDGFDIVVASEVMAIFCLATSIEDLKTITTENVDALAKGIVNLERHVENVSKNYGIPCVVSINKFTSDTKAELDLLYDRMKKMGVPVVLASHWGEGGKGAAELANIVVGLCEEKSEFKFVYEDKDTLWEKVNKIAKTIYRASEVTADTKVRAQIKRLQDDGYGHYPVCVAKTQSSFSTDPSLRGAPVGHVVNVREVRLAAGAEFVVMVCGDIMTMPGLPKIPSANKIDIVNGKVVGLF